MFTKRQPEHTKPQKHTTKPQETHNQTTIKPQPNHKQPQPNHNNNKKHDDGFVCGLVAGIGALFWQLLVRRLLVHGLRAGSIVVFSIAIHAALVVLSCCSRGWSCSPFCTRAGLPGPGVPVPAPAGLRKNKKHLENQGVTKPPISCDRRLSGAQALFWRFNSTPQGVKQVSKQVSGNILDFWKIFRSLQKVIKNISN